MPFEITMPQLSDTMSEGTLIKWNKKEGDAVKAGEELAEIETDKATMPMEAYESGTLAAALVKEGEKVNVGERIGVIALPGEKVEDIRRQYASGGAKPATAAPAPNLKPAAVVSNARAASVGSPLPADAPAAEGASLSDTEAGASPLERGRRRDRYESVQTGPDHTSEQLSEEASVRISRSRASDNGPATAIASNRRVRISPLARRVASGNSIDFKLIAGSGPGGRIIQRDVLSYMQKPRVASPAAAAPAAAPADTNAAPQRLAAGEKQVISMTKMRTAIASALQKSKQTIPHFYASIDVDAEEVSALRVRLNEQLKSEGVKLSLADFVAKAVASALLRHPALNATTDGAQITRYGDVNLGIAVAIPDGLIVPVLRGVDRMGLREIREKSVSLIERARAQRLKQDEGGGGTFTISSLGTFGVREFSAIINPPQVAILAVGAAEKRPVVRGNDVVARTVMTVTISADHRAVDGAAAAEFLRTFKSLIEEPALMLV